ncbi:MAG: peptide chain release factor 2 [Candidatus Saccharimonadales bacterium]
MDFDHIDQLSREINKTIESLNLGELENERANLKGKSEAADFWHDNKKASKIMQKLSELNEEINTWNTLQKEINEIHELASLKDEDLYKDIENQLKETEKKYKKIKNELAFSGPHDKNGAIISIYAGAGGTDAQDWAQMLLRMYTRWAEISKSKISIIDESAGDEAGIKSATIELKGSKIYGRLKGEQGVHRLVRLSPFNANNLRQTSFAKVEVLPEIDEPESIPLDESDLKIDVFRAGGHGGQSVNTTDSAVRVTHLPTKVTVTIQNERSQIQNKQTALSILRSKLAQMQIEQHKETIRDLKGPNQSAEWGSQIRNYVLHPYNMVKDLRTGFETSDTESVLDGKIDGFIEAYIENQINK